MLTQVLRLDGNWLCVLWWSRLGDDRCGALMWSRLGDDRRGALMWSRLGDDRRGALMWLDDDRHGVFLETGRYSHSGLCPIWDGRWLGDN
jgi:hypothetical protein